MIPLDRSQTALLVVDVQQGFSELCPDELPVSGALAIVPRVNQLLALNWKRIDASQDWHPPDHRSFLGRADNIYPPHCMMGTPGADFLPGLQTQRFHAIWRKGYQADFEAYAVTAQHPGMFDLYRTQGIQNVVVCGIAANICCFFAARDFKKAGFRVLLVEDASVGIDVPAAGLLQEKTKQEGRTLGIEYCSVREIMASQERQRLE